MRKFYAALFAFCFALAPLSAEALSEQYLSIRDKLTGLKNQSEFVTEQLLNVSENLQMSQQEAKEWEATSIALSESLTSITQQYNDCYEQLVIQQTHCKILKRALIGIASILILLLVVWSVALYLELTGRTNFL
ncbi:hypothetical protein HDR60_03330 [bacterium]|nr:hypothetical protein [bacterium]